MTLGDRFRWWLHCRRALRGKPTLYVCHDEELIHVRYYTGGEYVRSVAFDRKDAPRGLAAMEGITGTFTWTMTNTGDYRTSPQRVVFDSWALGTLRRGLQRAV